MNKRIFQIAFIIIVLIAFAKAISDYLSKIISDPTDYEFYIDDYPQGNISRISTLKFTFAKDFDLLDYEINKPINNDIIHFAPKIKGVLYWTDKRTIEFWPSDPLPENSIFYYRINLDKIFKGINKKKVFRNKFNTPEIKYSVNISGLDYYSDSIFTAHGDINFTDFVGFKTIHKNLYARLNNKDLNIHLSPTDLPLKFNFNIDSLVRTKDSDTLQIFWKETVSNDKFNISQIIIPPLNSFELLKYNIEYTPSPVIKMYFSDIINEESKVTTDSIIEVLGHPYSKIEYSKNKIIVSLSDSILMNTAGIKISKSLSSIKNIHLNDDIYFKVDINNQLPKIRNAFNNAIASIPSSNISFPVIAKNLKKIDISIFEIMPHNILQYLQSGKPNEYEELLRVGRKIADKEIDLSKLSNYNPNKFEKYDIYFNNIAINKNSAYHFAINYKKEYVSSKLSDSLIIDNESISQFCLYTDIDAVVKRLPSDTIMVFVFNKINGSPIRNANIEIYDFQQHKLISGKTDKYGNSNLKIKNNAMFLKVEYLDNHLYVKINENINNQVSSLSYLNPFFFSGNNNFVTKDSIDFCFFFNSNLTESQSPYKYELISPSQQIIYNTIVPVNYHAINRIKHKLPRLLEAGKYKIRLKEGEKVWEHIICVPNPKEPLISDSITNILCSDSAFYIATDNFNQKRVGDTILIKVDIPNNSYAYINTENKSSILNTKWVNKSGIYTFNQTITDNMWPWVKINTLIIDKYGRSTTSSRTIKVEYSDNKLEPIIISPFDVESGKAINLRVKEKNGAKMQYMVYLNISDSSNIKTNPLNYYSSIPQWNISTYMPVKEIPDISTNSGTQLFSNNNLNNNIWGPFSLEAGAINNHSFNVPYIIDIANFEIIAADPELKKFGYSAKKVWISTPIMLKFKTPKHIQPNEKLTIQSTIIITNPEYKTINIEIVSPKNCVLYEPSMFTFYHDSSTNIHNFDFSIKAKPLIENASVKVIVTGENINYTSTISIPIVSQNPKTISHIEQIIEPNKNWQTRIIPTGIKGNNICNVEFTVGKHMPIDYFITKMNQIDFYDIQSKISTALPFLFYKDIYTVPIQKRDSINSIIQNTIESLFLYQQPEGNFYYKLLNDKENEEFNFNAGLFLIETSKQGYLINNRKYNNWIRHLELSILFSDFDVNTNNDYILAQKLYLASLLEMVNKDAIRTLSNINNKSLECKFFLALAMLADGQNKEGQKLYDDINKLDSLSFYETALKLEITRYLRLRNDNKEIINYIINELNTNNDIPIKHIGMCIYFVEKSTIKFNELSRLHLIYRINNGKDIPIKSNSYYSIYELPFKYTLPKSIELINKNKDSVQTSITLTAIPEETGTIINKYDIKIDINYTDSSNATFDIANQITDKYFYANIKISNSGNTNLNNLILIYPLLSGWSILSNGYSDFTEYNNTILRNFSIKAKQDIYLRIPIKTEYPGNFWLAPTRIIDLNTGSTLVQLKRYEVNILKHH